jgi:hypothetical protein
MKEAGLNISGLWRVENLVVKAFASRCYLRPGWQGAGHATEAVSLDPRVSVPVRERISIAEF